MCLGTFPVLICARAPLQCPYVPGDYSGAHMCLSTLSVLICGWAPFRCQYMHGHNSGAHMCLGTIPVLIYARVVEHWEGVWEQEAMEHREAEQATVEESNWIEVGLTQNFLSP